jgi:hypothetical protein
LSENFSAKLEMHKIDTWRSNHEDGPAGHLLRLDEVNDEAGSLAGLVLTHQATSNLQSFAGLREAKSLNEEIFVQRILLTGVCPRPLRQVL